MSFDKPKSLLLRWPQRAAPARSESFDRSERGYQARIALGGDRSVLNRTNRKIVQTTALRQRHRPQPFLRA
jgi:hypothetical protein